VLVIGVANPAMASKVSFEGNVFEAIEKNIYFPGNYSQYATSVNEKKLDMNQLITEEAYNKVDFSEQELDTSGFACLEGKFIDEYTFVRV
jgi:alpha-acetolactate decarboxylase